MTFTTIVIALSLGQPFQIQPGFSVSAGMRHSAPADWPRGVPWVQGLKEYQPTQYSQYIVVQDGLDLNRPQHVSAASVFGPNPNNGFWARAGGMPLGSRSRFFIYTPPGQEIQVQTHYVQFPTAPRPLPQRFWRYPDGTVLVDQMLDADGKCFEVRMRKKVNGEWKNFRYTPEPEGEHQTQHWTASNTGFVELLQIDRVDYKVRLFPRLSRVFVRSSLSFTNHDGASIPRDYVGPGLHCNDCHVHAGSAKYGVGLRGSDETFSFSPFVEGTYILKEK